MLYNVSWAGDSITNHGSRQGVKPFVVVNHISAGSMTSMLNTFENPKNQVSSHYGIARDGSIIQYVDMARAAWCQGIVPERYKDAKTPIVQEMKVNPNLYCISIEHEGYIEKDTGKRLGIDGDITEAQFFATCWLHRYIKQYVADQFGVNITLNPYYVIGHNQIDPIRKPVCPGPQFPWQRMYQELAIADSMTMDEYEQRLTFLLSDLAKFENAVRARTRVEEIYTNMQNPKFRDAGVYKLSKVFEFMKAEGFIVD